MPPARSSADNKALRSAAAASVGSVPPFLLWWLLHIPWQAAVVLGGVLVLCLVYRIVVPDLLNHFREAKRQCDQHDEAMVRENHRHMEAIQRDRFHHTQVIQQQTYKHTEVNRLLSTVNPSDQYTVDVARVIQGMYGVAPPPDSPPPLPAPDDASPDDPEGTPTPG